MKTRRTFLRSGALAGVGLFLGSRMGSAAEPPPNQSTDLWQVIKNRRSVRSFKSNPIPEVDLRRILDAARLAPTSGNQQPWKFLVVKDPAKIAALKAACVERSLRRIDPDKKLSEEQRKERETSIAKRIGEYLSAPMYIVVLTDNLSQYPEYNHWDGPLAAGYLMLAARALGYGTVFITDAIPEDITKKVFAIPDRYTRVCITPLGVPTAWPTTPPKRPLDEFIASETLTTE
jgi:nitroreductase